MDKQVAKGVFIFLGFIILFALIMYGFGWAKVGYTKTVEKAQQNAERVVYERSNSFVKGKRQEIIKAYKEWSSTDSTEERKALETILALSLADFDEDAHIDDAILLSWIKKVKY